MSFPFSKAKLVNGELKIVETKIINPRNCPHVIFSGDHYNNDGSCKCYDPKETVMRSYGYKFSKKLGRWA